MVEVRTWSAAATAQSLRVPGVDDDKYSRGVVALGTGSDAYPGAAVLGVEAAWRAGAGFVRFVGAGLAAAAVIARRPETVVHSAVPEGRVDAWVIGSGTDARARSDAETARFRTILAGPAPVVVDAGALDLVADASAPTVLTPHAGEFARVQAQYGVDAVGDRADAVARAARRLGAVILLKGARTLIADPDGGVIEVTSGTGWLATAGTGDVLAGVIGAVLAANPTAPIAESAATGAWLHGAAGAAASGVGPGAAGRPIVALDVAEALPTVIAGLLT